MSSKIKILVIGDFHIPFRADRIPDPLIRFPKEQKVDLIAITGDLVQDYVLEPFKEWPLKVIKGNMDMGLVEKYPEKVILELPGINYKILLFHGSGIYPRGDLNHLRRITLKNNCKVLLTGHTHVPVAKKIKDVIIINPGSGTGVYGGGGGLGIPTWAYITLDREIISVVIYAIKSSQVFTYIQRTFIVK